MTRWLRLAGLALFCALFGFAGAAGTFHVLYEDRVAAAEAAGVQADKEATRLGHDVQELQEFDETSADAFVALTRMAQSADSAEYRLGTFLCPVLERQTVVTHVEWDAFGNLDVYKEDICVQEK